jgi:hypothetical protein
MMSLRQRGQGLYTCFELLCSGLDRTRCLCIMESQVCTLALSTSAPALTEHNTSASRRPKFVHLLRAPPLWPRQDTISLCQGGQGSYTCFELLRSGLDRTQYLCVKEAKVCILMGKGRYLSEGLVKFFNTDILEFYFVSEKLGFCLN